MLTYLLYGTVALSFTNMYLLIKQKKAHSKKVDNQLSGDVFTINVNSPQGTKQITTASSNYRVFTTTNSKNAEIKIDKKDNHFSLNVLDTDYPEDTPMNCEIQNIDVDILIVYKV